MRRRRLRSALWLLARPLVVLLLLVGLLGQEAAAAPAEGEAEAEAEATSQGTGSAPAPAPAPVPSPSPATGQGPGPGSGLGGGGSATGLSAWPASVYYHRPIYAHQSVQSALAAIEERLRALEPPALAHAHAHARRLDALDARVARLDALLQLRLDRLAESVSSRQLKEELVSEQLGRSVDAAFERLHHRLGFMETRLEVALAKLQTSQDSLSTRVERLDAGLGGGGGGGCAGGGGGGGGGEDLAHLKSGLDELRKSVHDNHRSLLNSTLAAVAAGDAARQRQFDSLNSALGHLQLELNRTLAVQNDAEGNGGGGGGGGGGGDTPLRHERHATAAAATSLLGAVDRHAASFGSKVTNMYNELWRRTQILEGLAKDSMALSNATRRELQEGMRSVSMQLSRYCSLQADKAKPSSHSRDNIEATLEEIRTSTSSYFQTIISIQHMFQASCHRIQEHEPMLEKYLAETLERIVGLLTNNKWENQVEDLHRYLKSHHTTVVRNVGHTTNTVLRAANYSSKEAQNLAASINEAHEGLLISTTDIQKGISRIQNEQQIVYQSLKEITGVMNELQKKVSNQSTSDGPYLKVFQCQESSAGSTNVTSELKRIFEVNQKHLSKEIHNLTQSITDILRSMGVHLSSHTSDDFVPSKKDFVNVLTATSEDYDDTSEPDSIPEALEENLNSIFDSHVPETTSILQNFTNSQTMPATNKQGTQIQILAQVQTSTSQPSIPLFGTTSQEHSINNIMSNAHNKIRENQSRDNTELVSNATPENQNNLSAPLNRTFVTIVHRAEPITSEEQVTYLSTDNISTVMTDPHNEHSNGKTFTHTVNNNSTAGSKLDLHNTNFALNERNSKNHTPNYRDINSSLSSRRENVSREYRNLNNSFLHRNTRTDDANINLSLHQTLQKNMSQLDSHADEQIPPAIQNQKNHSERDMHRTFPNTNRGIPRNTRHKNLNKNDTHYLYRLLNKLEELSNRLMNSESSDGSAPDNSEHTDDSQEDSEEYLDYSLPDSTFSSK